MKPIKASASTGVMSFEDYTRYCRRLQELSEDAASMRENVSSLQQSAASKDRSEEIREISRALRALEHALSRIQIAEKAKPSPA